MKAEHESIKYWRCPDTSCEGKGEFEHEEDFVSHLQTIHHESVPPDDISFLTSACVRSSPAKIRSCPLCPRETNSTDMDTESLLSHIACHVHSFSLRSLPWVQDNKDVTWVKQLVRTDSNYFAKNPYFDIGGNNGSSAQDQDALSDRSWEGLEPLEFEDESLFEVRSNADQDVYLPPVDREELRTKLHEARIEYPLESLRFYVPESEKASIITEEVVASEIRAARPHLRCSEARDQAKVVCHRARNLFALLAYLRKGDEICAFLDEDISDEDFPFERSKRGDRKCDFSLDRKNGSKINALDHWKPSELETLGRKQWYMIAPIFKDRMKHYVFQKSIVLPFITEDDDWGEYINQTGGGYSDVFTTRIHNSHHEYHSYWAPTVSSLPIISELLVTNLEFAGPRSQDRDQATP